ncbi:hypothetical protein Q8A67_001607 [Cirrhinus molitorella]|uniref:C-type lectin domain-containing protein n=1 Tax=Cirrhinus molitorella TaxID=172907 RepID=A0AA88TW05_9TELE|nr:hypothetical protein Q8A67_001607 [Cirrhinus molitorella]
MEQRLIHLFLLSGFLSVILCGSCEYILITEYKTWHEAQDYCRQNHIDLATVQTDEEWSKLDKLRDGVQFYIWIGLYDDVDAWRWSYQDQSVAFLHWDFDQPNNLYGNQYCVYLWSNGYWWDEACHFKFPFFCQSRGQPVLVTDPPLSWNNAQNYCREKYTDLFTIKNIDVNRQLTSMIKNYPCAWIGLFRDSWKWSDNQTSANSSLRWALGQPDNLYGQDSCAALDYGGQIADESCSTLHYYLCQTTQVKHQILRLEMKAGDNVNDQAITASVLYKLQQKLQEQGIAADVKLSWRLQPNGTVFQKLLNGTVLEKLPNESTAMNKQL